MKKALMVSALLMLAMTAQAQQASELLCFIYSPAEQDLQRVRSNITNALSEEIQIKKNNFTLTAQSGMNRVEMTIETPEGVTLSQGLWFSQEKPGVIISVTEASGNNLDISCQLVY